MSEHKMSDYDVEEEIERLRVSPLVLLARQEEAYRRRRRVYMEELRRYENRGRQLEQEGITLEELIDLELNPEIT